MALLKKYKLAGFLLASLTILLFQNCSNVSLIPKQAEQSITPYIPPSYEIKPALAVRAPACISCHAQVHGDLVTDFGYKDPFFFGRTQYQENNSNGTNSIQKQSFKDTFYGLWNNGSFNGQGNATGANYFTTLNDPAVTIDGSFVIPHAQLLQAKDNSTLTLKNFLLSQNALSADITSKLVEKQSIYIGAPTAQMIRNLISLQQAVLVDVSPYFQAVWRSPTAVLNGVQLQFGAINRTEYYISNNGTLTCRGDVFVDGTLFLNNVQVDTDQAGCRIYVTGSVFIQGPPTYVGDYALKGANLQISSARAIMVGMSTMSDRLQYAAGLRNAPTYQDNLNFNQDILHDRDLITGLTDSAGYYKKLTLNSTHDTIAYFRNLDSGGNWEPTEGHTQTEVDNCGSNCTDSGYRYAMNDPVSGRPYGQQDPQRICINSFEATFAGLVLNAPIVQSRYYGKFYGSIIAEFALFALGHLEFYTDHNLDTVEILPLLKESIYQISDN